MINWLKKIFSKKTKWTIVHYEIYTSYAYGGTTKCIKYEAVNSEGKHISDDVFGCALGKATLKFVLDSGNRPRSMYKTLR